MSFHLNSPWYLLLLLAVPLLIYIIYRFRHFYSVSLPFSSIKGFVTLGWKSNGLEWIPISLFIAALVALILALARPQLKFPIQKTTEGVDIVVVFDISISMFFVDFDNDNKPPMKEAFPNTMNPIFIDEGHQSLNRFDIAQNVLLDFIRKRPNDRIGLVVFSGSARMVSLPTLSHEYLLSAVEKIQFEEVSKEGTAIGDAIGIGINALRTSKAKSRIMILITDGNSNVGRDPVDVASIAAKKEIKIFSIGVGSKGLSLQPIKIIQGKGMDFLDRDDIMTELYREKSDVYYKLEDQRYQLDEQTLNSISSLTNGKPFRAYDQEDLVDVFKSLDEQEITELQADFYDYFEEMYMYFLFVGACLFVLAMFSQYLLFRTFP